MNIIQNRSKAIVTLKVQEWDTDGEKVKGLPKTVKVEIPYARFEAIEDLHDTAMDKASDAVGWAIASSILKSVKFLY